LRPRVPLLPCLLLLAGCDLGAGNLRVSGVSTGTPSIGGTLVVHGAGFTDAPPVRVTIGGAEVPPAFVGAVTAGRIELTVPAGTPSGPLVVTDALGHTAAFRDELHVIASLEIDPLEALPGTPVYPFTVRALDVSGEPVPGAQLLLEASAGTFSPGPYVITDSKGEAAADLDLTSVDGFVEVKVRAEPLYAAAYYTDPSDYPHGNEVTLTDGTTSLPVYLDLAFDGSVTVSTLNRRPAGPPVPALAAPRPEPGSPRAEDDPREGIVAYRTDVAMSSLAREEPLADLGLERLKSAGGLDLVRVPEGVRLDEALARLNADPRVEYAEPNYRMRLAGALPSDPELYRQWGAFAVGAPSAWTVSDGSGVVVAVVDTAIDHSHPDLSGALLPGFDFCADDHCTTYDGDPHAATTAAEHGTHVAGIVAAAPDNGYGTVGVAPAARVLPVKVFSESEDGTTYAWNVAQAIRWAAGLSVDDAPANPNPADVINLSLGDDDNSQTVADAIDAAVAAGAVVVAASGNQGKEDGVLYPAALPNVIAVGAIEEEWDPAGYSNFGEGLDLMAPGTAVLSSNPGGGVRYLDGTSMATPHVAAVAALLLAADPTLTPEEVRDALAATAYLPVGGDAKHYGAGVVRADGALGLPAPTSEADRYMAVTVAGHVASLDLREGVSEAVPLAPEELTAPVEVSLEHGGRVFSGTLESW